MGEGLHHKNKIRYYNNNTKKALSKRGYLACPKNHRRYQLSNPTLRHIRCALILNFVKNLKKSNC